MKSQTSPTQKDPTMTRTTDVRQKIMDEINALNLKAGDKIPTEKYFTEKYNVSRTTIRDAISGLKALGVLRSQQGSGVFINESSLNTPPRLSSFTSEVNITSAISMLEIRMPLETEMVRLATKRRSPEQEVEIIKCFNAFQDKVKNNENSEKEDFDFHLAIAKATNNPKMVDLILWAGQNSIPRSQLYALDKNNIYKNNGRSLVNEHQRIMAAILNNDEETASVEMHNHLFMSLKRYREILYNSEHE